MNDFMFQTVKVLVNVSENDAIKIISSFDSIKSKQQV